MGAAAPGVSTGRIDLERAIATLRSFSSEYPPVRRLFVESGRYRAGLPELEVR